MNHADDRGPSLRITDAVASPLAQAKLERIFTRVRSRRPEEIATIFAVFIYKSFEAWMEAQKEEKLINGDRAHDNDADARLIFTITTCMKGFYPNADMVEHAAARMVEDPDFKVLVSEIFAMIRGSI